VFELSAYIDPSSGSLIVQVAIATLVAVPFFLRQQIGRAVRTINRGASPGSPPLDDANGLSSERDA
jgi:hypothetical protein